MDVAFDPADPDRGYAVGKGGVLLGYGKSWDQEALPAGFESANLTSIAFAGSEAIVAAGGDLLVNDGGGWHVDASAHALLDRVRGGNPAALRGRRPARRRRRRRRARHRDRARRRRARPGGSRASRCRARPRSPRPRSATAARCARSSRSSRGSPTRPPTTCPNRTRPCRRRSRRRSACRATATCCARRRPAGRTSSGPRSPPRATTAR